VSYFERVLTQVGKLAQDLVLIKEMIFGEQGHLELWLFLFRWNLIEEVVSFILAAIKGTNQQFRHLLLALLLHLVPCKGSLVLFLF